MPNALLTNIIYVDTCVFEYRQFDLESKVFSALLNLVREGHARLLTSSVTVGECHKHIKAHVGQASTVRNKLAAEARILKAIQRGGRFSAEFYKVFTSRGVTQLVGQAS